MKIGFLQEQDGSFSMRRALALYYAMLSGASLLLGAINGKMTATYGGIVAALAVLVLLGLTTLADIKNAIPGIAAINSLQPQNKPDTSIALLSQKSSVREE